MSVEAYHVRQVAVALLTLSAWTWCYVRGGRDRKWIRRWVGSALLVSGCLWLAGWSWTFRWAMTASYGTYPAALSLGYGAFSLWPKLWRRVLYGAAVGMAALPILWPRWEIGLAQALLGAGVSAWAGIRNPTSAVGEEGMIALGMGWLVPFAMIR